MECRDKLYSDCLSVLKSLGYLVCYSRPEGSVEIHLNGIDYYVGTRVSNDDRILTDEYIQSDQYKILFHAALSLIGSHHIKYLTTGLPVIHSFNQKMRRHLKELLIGEHIVNGERYFVEAVCVVPQPAGGYARGRVTGSDVSNTNTLVLDPGYFSVDWLVIESDNDAPKESMGTSLWAMSTLVEEVAKNAQRDLNMVHPPIDAFDEMMRSGGTKLFYKGEYKDALPYIGSACKTIAKKLKGEMSVVFRHYKKPVGAILLVGGGAQYYKPIAERLFPDAHVIAPEPAVLSNAMGFHIISANRG